jgi:CxxC motif-containing protein (DUF1111 family)
MKKSGLFVILALTAAVAVLNSQSGGVAPGAPLRGITGKELELFRAGLDDFTEVESADDGLGPAFNGTSCAVCHSIPAIGGVGTMTEVRAGYRDDDGVFHELNGGTLYHLFSIPNHKCQVVIPPEANVIARRAPLAVFGDGLIEAIADATIAAQEDPNDRNGDGISGRVGWVNDLDTGARRAGRFGWKAQHATLLSFGADAYRNEMGITNDLLPNEMALGIDEATMRECSPKKGLEDVRDRRTGLRGIDNFANFMRFLAPIEPLPFSASARSGERLFSAIGCAACHTPVLTTAQNSNPLFDRKAVNLYSDLLLHDIGSGDGIPQAGAEADEIRTTPLWGLRFRKPLMHDGATATVAGAIERHAGEAEKVKARFDALSKQDREAILAFLDAL